MTQSTVKSKKLIASTWVEDSLKLFNANSPFLKDEPSWIVRQHPEMFDYLFNLAPEEALDLELFIKKFNASVDFNVSMAEFSNSQTFQFLINPRGILRMKFFTKDGVELSPQLSDDKILFYLDDKQLTDDEVYMQYSRRH